MTISLVETLARIKELSIIFKAFTGNKATAFNGLKFFSPTIKKSTYNYNFILKQEHFEQFTNLDKEKKLTPELQNYIKAGKPYALITPGNASNFEKVKSVVNDKSRTKLISFINTFIPKQDRGLWISGLALRTLTSRDEVQRIKRDMRYAAGHRGNNIANLCNSEYLESKIIPLHKKLSRLPKGEDDFLGSYEQIVNYPVFAVFVGETQTKDEVLEEVRTKIEILLHDNNQDQIDIHGLNQTNVNKIRAILETILSEYKSRILKHSVQGGDTYIKIQIFLKHKNTQ